MVRVRVSVRVRVRVSAPLGDERKLEAVHRRVLVDGDALGAAREQYERERGAMLASGLGLWVRVLGLG